MVDGYIDLRDGTFDTPTEDGTVTEPANADNVIAVGSFDTKKFPGGATDPAQDISFFSSLGPTRDDRSKPDLTAPGYVIYSTRSFDAPVVNYGPFGLVPGNDNYAILAGTSMAAPHVTGIAALVWESNPNLTGAQMRERLKKTADPPPGGPDNTWGHGKVNALRAVTESVASITAPSLVLPAAPVTLTSENSSGAFGEPLDGHVWQLIPLPAGPPALLSTSSSAIFTPPAPRDDRRDLTVSQSNPSSTPAGFASTVIRVNTLPVASIVGPSISDNTDPVAFRGVATDPDPGQAKIFRWVLVSRPNNSSAVALTTSGPDTAILSPDSAGAYIVGLRVDDGLDNSSLVIKSFTVSPVSTGSGGGGGCSILYSGTGRTNGGSLLPLVLLLLPLMILAVRRSVDRRNHSRQR